jgi:hypothetical protein
VSLSRQVMDALSQRWILVPIVKHSTARPSNYEFKLQQCSNIFPIPLVSIAIACSFCADCCCAWRPWLDTQSKYGQDRHEKHDFARFIPAAGTCNFGQCTLVILPVQCGAPRFLTRFSGAAFKVFARHLEMLWRSSREVLDPFEILAFTCRKRRSVTPVAGTSVDVAARLFWLTPGGETEGRNRE